METLIAENKIKLKTTSFAWIVSAFIVILLPVIYCLFAYQTLKVTFQLEVDMTAERISKVVFLNPSMWIYQEYRIIDQFSTRLLPDNQQIYSTITDQESNTILSYGSLPAPPHLTVKSHIYNSGFVAGEIEFTRSLFPLLVRTFVSFLISSLIGLGIYFFLREIPLKALEESIDLLVAEKERLRVIFNTIGSGLVTTNVEGKIILCNEEFLKITGLPRQKLLNFKFDALMKELINTTNRPERPIDLKERLFQSNESSANFFATEIITRSGQKKIIRCSGEALLHEGELAGTVFMVRDVTEEILTQEKINRIEQLESVGVVAGGIAHDFNNFLATIITNLSRIKTMIAKEDPAQEILSNSEESVLRARDLTEQLITFSRGGELQLQTTDLREILRRESEFMLSGSNIEVQYQFAADLWPADVDTVQLSQLVQNLVLNALQAMQQGGKLKISAKNSLLPDKARYSLAPDCDYIEITFADNGIGIEAGKIPDIFTPFYSDKKDGSGLGLAVTHSVVKRHGGEISVSSEPGKGTVFLIMLPASRDKQIIPEPLQPETWAAETIVSGEAKILLMDDNIALASTISAALVEKGYQVVTALEGMQAIRFYLQAMEEDTPFDLVILDLTVAGGLGGKQTMVDLLEIDPEVKALVSSGYANDPVMANYGEHGFKGAVRKPFRLSLMVDMINKTLAG